MTKNKITYSNHDFQGVKHSIEWLSEWLPDNHDADAGDNLYTTYTNEWDYDKVEQYALSQNKPFEIITH